MQSCHTSLARWPGAVTAAQLAPRTRPATTVLPAPTTRGAGKPDATPGGTLMTTVLLVHALVTGALLIAFSCVVGAQWLLPRLVALLAAVRLTARPAPSRT